MTHYFSVRITAKLSFISADLADTKSYPFCMILQAHAYQEPFASMPVNLLAPTTCNDKDASLVMLTVYLQPKHQDS